MISSTRNVEVKIEFVRIGEIDEKFHAEIRITTSWIEIANLEMTRYDPEIDWNPQIYISNLISESKEKNNYEIEKQNNHLKITETKSIKGQFWEKMELYDVPFDLQELNVIVKSKHRPDEINFLSNFGEYLPVSQQLKRTFVDQQKWKLFYMLKLSDKSDQSHKRKRKWNLFKRKKISNSQDIEKKQVENLEKNRNKITATCYVARHPGYFMFNAFFLIFLITASALTVFSIPQNAPHSRLQTTYTIMSTSVLFKWVFNRSLPSVSYLTLLDKYSICGIFYIHLLAAWHSLVGAYSKQWDPEVDQWLLIFFTCLFILGHICFFLAYLSITKRKQELLKIERKIKEKYLNRPNDEIV